MAITEQPPKPYAEVKSEYIKSKIREGSFEDEEHRKYIHALIWLEKCVTEERPAGWPTGMMLSKITEKYSDELKIIRRELDPESAKIIRIKSIVNAIEESLEPDEYKLDRIKERLDNRETWKEIAKRG